MLNWAKRFNIFCYLDNHQYAIAPHRYECLLAAGAVAYIDESHDWTKVDSFLSATGRWSFGHMAYELKNQLYGGSPAEKNNIDFPDFFFFQPEVLLILQEKELCIQAADPEAVYAQLMQPEKSNTVNCAPIALQQRLQKDEYLQKIRQLQQRILRGDCYEINFCQEFFAEGVAVDVFSVYEKLTSVSPTPFSVLYRLYDKFLMCASPERFLYKSGNKVVSQPMKGTARRQLTDKEADEQAKNNLLADAKERAENVMVVDLVRNDLAKVCQEASVHVEELFGIYSYPQVHQMVSTVSGQLKDNICFSEIIAATFPMGSMTGAPKQKVMELIDKYEATSRGLFSGSVGYIAADGDFDFNVVIRSILYNATHKYLSYLVGSGITFYSDAEKEWEECLLKGEAIKKVLTG